MANPEIVKRIQALMSRAADPGATEEEQRTSAHIAAKLCREHNVTVGELDSGAGAVADDGNVTRARAEVVIDGVRTVVETFRAGGAGLNDVFGFDVFGFAQGLLRERAKESIESALRVPVPAPRRRKATKRKR